MEIDVEDKTSKAKKVISFRLPIVLIYRLDKLARKARRLRSDYVRMAIEEVVKRGGLDGEVGK